MISFISGKLYSQTVAELPPFWNPRYADGATQRTRNKVYKPVV